VRQKLEEGDMKKQVEFAQWMLSDMNLVDKTLWSDEAYFSLDGEVKQS
jgi:hypothetical protein